MKRFSGKLMKAAAAFFLPLFMLFSVTLPPVTSAFAVEVTSMDESPIETDLEGVDLTFYPYNANDIHSLIEGVGFMEYAYSLRPDPTRFFGLYFYVYNPTQKKVITHLGANSVNMATEYNKAGEPVKYANLSITFLDASSDNRFLKFKLTNAGAARQRAGEYAAAHNGMRRYDVASVELWFEGDKNATDAAPLHTETEEGEIIEQGATYYCTGYAAGCASDPNAESTLSIVSRDLLTVRLQIHHTYFRPEGTNGKNRYTHDSLNSFYFALPKTLTGEYGTLTRIRGEYRKALSADMLVTGDQTYYDRFSSVIGQDLGLLEEDDPFPYFFGGIEKSVGVFDKKKLDWIFHAPELWKDSKDKISSSLHYIFKAENGDASNYDVPSEDLEKWIEGYTASHPIAEDKLVEGKYHPALFEWVAPEKTYFDIKADDVTPDLTGQTIGQNWLQQWWGSSGDVQSEAHYEGKEAIHEVTEEDFVFNSDGSSLNAAATSEKNFVAAADVEDFRAYYNEKSAENDVFLVRFAVDDYMASEAIMAKYSGEKTTAEKFFTWWFTWQYDPGAWQQDGEIKTAEANQNAFVAQEYFYLNFQVIDLTLARDGKETVIGVVMDPVDIFPDITHPVFATTVSLAIILALGAAIAVLTVALGFAIKADSKEKFKNEIKETLK